ncbi:hypothetical protein ENUP19_0100G0046, partial [Entamoeba nuttalli]
TTNVPLIHKSIQTNGNTNLPSNYISCMTQLYVIYCLNQVLIHVHFHTHVADITIVNIQQIKKWKQQYIYLISKDGELTFEDNSEATNGY